MRHRSFIFLALFLFAMLAGSIGVYAYDASRDDLIADGITVGGVNVGGMRAGEARAAIEEQLTARLSEPLVVRYKKQRTFRLTAAEARLRVASERMVQEALAKSREGNVVSRTLRGITGDDPEEAALPARVSYSRRAVEDLVKKVEGGVNQPAQDAEVTFAGASLGTVEGQPGIEVKTAKLRRAIRAELVLPHADRVVEVSTSVVQPEVTREELASQYPVVLTVNRPSFELRLWKNLQLSKTYTIAVGAVGYDTPSGLYHIQNKAVNPAWTMPDSDWVAPGRPRHGGPGRRTGEPAQGALARYLRRRGHPRHGRDELAGDRRFARLPPDGDPGRDRAVRPGPGLDARLYRVADPVDRDLAPPGVLQRGLTTRVSNAKGAYEHAAFLLREHRVPHRRGVARALDRMPRRDRALVLVDEAGIGKLVARRHPPVLVIDPEDRHRIAA